MIFTMFISAGSDDPKGVRPLELNFQRSLLQVRRALSCNGLTCSGRLLAPADAES
jgi:hypothetical protein